MPLFTSNIPHHDLYQRAVLPTPERVGAPTDYTGRGVTIAIVDSGFYMHPDIAGRVVVHADATTSHITEQPQVTEASDLSEPSEAMPSIDGVASSNEWDPLEEAIVGRMDTYPPDEGLERRAAAARSQLDELAARGESSGVRWLHALRMIAALAGGAGVAMLLLGSLGTLLGTWIS